MSRFFWLAGIVVTLGWGAMVVNAHDDGRAVCVPMSARTGPLGIIGCVDTYSLQQGVCTPMSAWDGPVGLISCNLESLPQEQMQP